MQAYHGPYQEGTEEKEVLNAEIVNSFHHRNCALTIETARTVVRSTH